MHIFPMLCAKRKLTGEIVTAYFASKAHGPFKFPDCDDEVILKTGRRTMNHFAHVNPLAYRYAENESEEHWRCKMEIFQALQKEPVVRNVALELPLGTNRPDVSAYCS
jgi:competence CoiA-like predicted nuclease